MILHRHQPLYLFASCIWLFLMACGSSPNPTPSPALGDTAGYFVEGLCVLNQKGRKVFVDKQGMTPASLDEESIAQNLGLEISSLDHFHEGLAVLMVQQGGDIKWGYINRQGKNPFGKWYDYAGEFHGGYAIVKQGDRWELINPSGDSVLPDDYEGISPPKDGRIWLQKEKVWALYSFPERERLGDISVRGRGDFHGGIARVVKKKRSEMQFALNIFMDKGGRIIGGEYKEAGNFSEGLAAVKPFGSGWGFINNKGEEAIPFIYDTADNFSEGLAAVSKDGRWYYINKAGEKEIALPLGIEFARRFQGGYAMISDSLFNVGFIDKAGREAVPRQYAKVYGFMEGLAAVKTKEGKKWGFVNGKGEMVIPPRFDKVSPLPHDPKKAGFSDGVAKVAVDNYEFLINKKGDCVLGCLE